MLLKSARDPIPVLAEAVLLSSAPVPRAVLSVPNKLRASAAKPTAVLAEPVVRLKRARVPSAVLLLG
jgi:hypothetical protein